MRRSDKTKICIGYLKHAQRIFQWFQGVHENQFSYAKKIEISNKTEREAFLDSYIEIKEAAEMKNELIDDMLRRADENLAKDREAEVSRNEKEKQVKA